MLVPTPQFIQFLRLLRSAYTGWRIGAWLSRKQLNREKKNRYGENYRACNRDHQDCPHCGWPNAS